MSPASLARSRGSSLVIRARTRCRSSRSGTSCAAVPISPSPKSTSSTGCIRTCRSSYYTDMLRGFKRIRPSIHLKRFTAVEIAFADLHGKTDEQVLVELQEAGLDSLPGGGAEIFAERVRRKIAHDKCDADRYLSIHKLAHRLGLRTNITMLYGHIETAEDRVDHMMRTRALQDETRGLQAFIPLAFHPDNNQMRKLPAPSGVETLRVLAVSRLMLDNVPHIKGFWIATGVHGSCRSGWCQRPRRNGAGGAIFTWPARIRRRP